MWQEYLPGTKGEFTCGVYRCLDDSVRVVAMRRRLAAGVTAYAQVVHEESIEKLCKQIAESLNLRGSINIQLRILEGRGPVVFEINPRFSSTVGMRHRIGFCDLIWSIQEQYSQVPADNAPNIYPEVCFSRRFAEVMA
jgi:carbamoyl-phosphate synthase large subunit